MQNIVLIASFQLNNMSLLPDWKKMSDGISESLKQIDGFISRDSAIDEDNRVYCIVKWESAEKQATYRVNFDKDPNMQKEMIEFARLVNMETMTSEVPTVVLGL